MIQKGLFVSLENKIKKKNSEFFGFDILLIPVHKHKKTERDDMDMLSKLNLL